MKNKKLGNDGFSLIEIIIVIAIIAVLAAALAPQLIKYIGKSKETTCQYNMGRIYEAVSFEIAEKEKNYNSYGVITDLSMVDKYDGTNCPSDGVYRVEVKQLDSERYSIDIQCSIHGKYKG